MKTASRLSILLVLLSVAFAIAAPDASIPAIKAVKEATPNDGVFKAAARGKPLEIKSEEDAAKHFDEKSLAALKEQVDFENQFVLVFAWRGSGQDKLSYDVAESFPEQVQFKLTPGRTRDLRPHIHVYALRSNVKWSMK